MAEGDYDSARRPIALSEESLSLPGGGILRPSPGALVKIVQVTGIVSVPTDPYTASPIWR